MVGLSATLRAEGKPTSTMVSLVVVSCETSVSFSEEGNFSVSWGCFATILLGRVAVRMNEEVHVNPQLIQESPPVIPVFPVVLTAPTGASFGVLILAQRWRTWTVSEPLGPSDIRGDFLPFRSFLATWCLSSFQSRPHHLLWTLSPTLFLSPASIWKLWGKTHVLDILRPELTRFFPVKLAFPSRQSTQSPYPLCLFSASSLQLTETTDAQGKGESDVIAPGWPSWNQLQFHRVKL